MLAIDDGQFKTQASDGIDHQPKQGCAQGPHDSL
jgi:hypothetical protein